MALTADARLSNASAPAAGRDFGGLFAKSLHRLAQWREYRRTLNELQALDDRTLADMSLNRSALPGG